jgi:hypothetical protein
MTPYELTMVGLSLDSIGAFLLSVGAIKIANRQRLTRMSHAFTQLPYLSFGACIITIMVWLYMLINGTDFSLLEIRLSLFLPIGTVIYICLITLIFRLLDAVEFFDNWSRADTSVLIGLLFLLLGFAFQVYANYLLLPLDFLAREG